MTLSGKSFDGRQIDAQLSRVDLNDPKKFLLLNRGVHWVNSFPFRR